MSLTDVEEALERAIAAAGGLGLDAREARSVAGTMAQRRGYPSDLYVLVLAGGTGVGKSSLLNALAGREVSPPGVRRPTTTTPVALLPEDRVVEAGPLLEWLGGAEVSARPGPGPEVAIVDLPDLDSIAPEHAARVDLVLPRADAVLWVTDPEKYDDAILHERYLRRWMPRLAYQAVVINKADLLTPGDGARVRADLRERLARAALPVVPILLVAAIHDVGPVRTWLLEGADAKEVVHARLRQAASQAAHALAIGAGVDGPSPPRPLVAEGTRRATVAASREATLDLIGPAGLRSRAAAAARSRARSPGADPIGLIRSLLGRGTGSREGADPVGYLRRWREHGSLDRSVAPLRRLLVAVGAELPPTARAGLLGAVVPADLGERLAREVDRVVVPLAERPLPRDRLWPLIEGGRMLALAAIAIAVVWLVALFVAGAVTPTATFDVPGLGPMPMPAVLLISGSLAWLLLGRLLHWHAGRLGVRWADQVLESVSTGIAGAIEDTLAQSVGSVDTSRRTLWEATSTIDDEGRQRGAPTG